MGKKISACASVFLVAVLVVSATIFRQQLKDQYTVRTNRLPVDAAELMDQLELTDSAAFIYKASLPEIQPADEFNNSCSNVAREHSIVLGCYTKQRFFVFDVQDERLSGAKEVTAAHELLHAVYERMSSSEKRALDTQLQTTASAINDPRFKSTIAEYQRTEPDQIANELHSIMATEIEVLPSSLEQHYAKYFKNRKKIVNFAKQYEATFTNLDTQIKSYDAALKTLREQKDNLESSLKSQQVAIESNKNRLDTLRSNGEASEYNQAVPSYNRSIQEYNADVSKLKQVIADYNQTVEKRNALATTQNNLVQQLDSTYQPL